MFYNKEEFVAKALKVHGTKYDYFPVEYIYADKKVKINCPEHGIFEQSPTKHLCGHGCPKCGKIRNNLKKLSNVNDFIHKANARHKNKYDYSSVVYLHSKQKVKIFCPDHGIFEQTPNAHLRGSGCSICGAEIKRRKLAFDKEEFIRRCIEQHGTKYDYKDVEYRSCLKKVKIICPKHGLFLQIPMDHMNGRGCQRCGVESSAMSRTKDMEEFLSKAIEIHKNRYDYSKIIYKNLQTKVEIICPKHGIFKQLPYGHLQGYGCSKCSHELMGVLSLEEFLEKAKKLHGDKFDYSLVDYKNYCTHVKIKCSKHGLFEQLPQVHLGGHGCPKCAIEYRAVKKTLKTQEFIDKARQIHGNTYDYSEVNYIKNYNKVKIICPEHGSFYQSPQSHISGKAGCPVCQESHGERKIAKFLKDHQIPFIRQHSFENCIHKNPLHYDFFTPGFNTCIEFDGKQHFYPVEHFGGVREFEKLKKLDNIKNHFCLDNGINLIRISYKKKDQEITSILEKNLCE